MHAEPASDVLIVIFPRRLAAIGLGLFSSGLAVAIILLAVQYRDNASVSWLGLIFGAGAILGLSYSLTQVLRPTVQLRADHQKLVIHRRSMPDEGLEVPWHQVLAMDYVEKMVGRSNNASQFKVVRLRLDHPPPPRLRYFDDDVDILHIDAFAAEPGGEELLRRLEALRPLHQD